MTLRGVDEMARTEAQRKANAKYNSTHRKTLACAVNLKEYEDFKQIAEEQGKTISGMILDFVRQTIAGHR